MTEKAQWGSITSPGGDQLFKHVNPWEMVHLQTTVPWQSVLYISLNITFGDISSELSVSYSETFAICP